MQLMGLPKNSAAVSRTEAPINTTTVNWQCRRKIELSFTHSPRARYALSPPRYLMADIFHWPPPQCQSSAKIQRNPPSQAPSHLSTSHWRWKRPQPSLVVTSHPVFEAQIVYCRGITSDRHPKLAEREEPLPALKAANMKRVEVLNYFLVHFNVFRNVTLCVSLIKQITRSSCLSLVGESRIHVLCLHEYWHACNFAH